MIKNISLLIEVFVAGKEKFGRKLMEAYLVLSGEKSKNRSA